MELRNGKENQQRRREVNVQSDFFTEYKTGSAPRELSGRHRTTTLMFPSPGSAMVEGQGLTESKEAQDDAKVA